jgi:glycerate kinase
MLRILEAGLARLAVVIRRDLGCDVRHMPGGGAAGGLGAGLVAFADGRLRPGVEVVMDAVGLARRLRECDLVITGEGRMDWQTAYGKAPIGVARAAKSLGIPVIAICGSFGKGIDRVLDAGIDAYFLALSRPVPEEELPRVAKSMLTNCAEQVGRLLAVRLDERHRRASSAFLV